MKNLVGHVGEDLQAVGDDMGSKHGTRCCHRSIFSLVIVVPLNSIDTSSPSARARFRRALRMTLPGIFLTSFHSLNFWVYCLRLEEHEESTQASGRVQPTNSKSVARPQDKPAYLAWKSSCSA